MKHNNEELYIRVLFKRDEFTFTLNLKGNFSTWRLSEIEAFAFERLKKILHFPPCFRIVDEYEIKTIEFV